MGWAERQLSRRDFLQLAALFAAGVGPTIVNELVTAQVRRTTLESAPLAETFPRPQSVLFGGWYGWDWDGAPKDVLDRSHIVTLFPEWNNPTWRAADTNRVVAAGKLPMISIGPDRTIAMDRLGEHYCEIRDRLSEIGSLPCLIRPFYEMNGDWMGYGSRNNSPEAFVRGWRWFYEQVHTLCPKARVVWSPNVRYPLVAYYPGDGWVDIVGLDGYNKAQRQFFNDRTVQPNLSFSELFGPDLRTLHDISHKPVMICEVGIGADHPDALNWISEAIQTAPFYGVTAVCGFFETKVGIGEADWNLLGLPGGVETLSKALDSRYGYVRSSMNVEELMRVVCDEAYLAQTPLDLRTAPHQ